MPTDNKTVAGVALALGLSMGAIGGLAVNDKVDLAIGSTPVPEAAAEITAPALGTKISESGAVGNVTCKTGQIDNMPKETIYCTDGGTAGFVLKENEAQEIGREFDWSAGVLVSRDVDGKFYAVEIAE